MIDMQELDEIEKELAIYKFKYEMAVAEKSIREEGTISADDLEAELGVGEFARDRVSPDR